MLYRSKPQMLAAMQENSKYSAYKPEEPPKRQSLPPKPNSPIKHSYATITGFPRRKEKYPILHTTQKIKNNKHSKQEESEGTQLFTILGAFNRSKMGTGQPEICRNKSTQIAQKQHFKLDLSPYLMKSASKFRSIHKLKTRQIEPVEGDWICQKLIRNEVYCLDDLY